jgi:hypothetical protein
MTKTQRYCLHIILMGIYAQLSFPEVAEQIFWKALIWAGIIGFTVSEWFNKNK